MNLPIYATEWLKYDFWVDWLEESWTDVRLEKSDYASRPFTTLQSAQAFAKQLPKSSIIIMYERGTSRDGDTQNLFIFKQLNAESEFSGYSDLVKIKSGYGYRWTDGETATTPENYTPSEG